eukprot:6680280-Karenia_brevis.AAC.1
MQLNTDIRIEPHNVSIYAMQMHKMNIIFAGLHESRSSADSKELHGYHRFITDSVHGREGCELWCNVDQAYARVGGKSHYLNIKRIRVLCSTPTLLVADCRQKYLQCRLIVGHAPNATYLNDDPGQLGTWYKT